MEVSPVVDVWVCVEPGVSVVDVVDSVVAVVTVPVVVVVVGVIPTQRRLKLPRPTTPPPLSIHSCSGMHVPPSSSNASSHTRHSPVETSRATSYMHE